MSGNPETLTNAAGVVVFEGTTSESGGTQPVPAADPANSTVDTTTYDNTFTGEGKLTTLVVPEGGDCVAAFAQDGDAFPRLVIADNTIFFGDGTTDPTAGSTSLSSTGYTTLGFMGASAYGVQSPASENPSVTAGTADPSAGSGHESGLGSLYLRESGGGSGAGEVWAKTGAADTAWTKITP